MPANSNFMSYLHSSGEKCVGPYFNKHKSTTNTKPENVLTFSMRNNILTNYFIQKKPQRDIPKNSCCRK